MYTNPQYFSDELHVSLSRGEMICSYDIKTFYYDILYRLPKSIENDFCCTCVHTVKLC